MMRRTKFFRGMAIVLAMLMGISCMPTKFVAADSTDEKYLTLGADLTSSEQKKVLEYLGVSSTKDYTVISVTNDEEHDYLDGYLSKSVIGTRALSSITLEKTSSGSGINVKTTNITYCTENMYSNALATAGVEDADINVAGPFKISGTAALVGVMKTYEAMTGEKISDESKDAATDELITTGEVGESLGSKEDAANLIASVKEKVAEDNLTSPSDISDAIDESAKELELSLSEEDKQKIQELMDKISDLDLDVSQLKEQAQNIYDKLQTVDTDGILDKIAAFFESIMNTIKGFF